MLAGARWVIVVGQLCCVVGGNNVTIIIEELIANEFP